MANRVINGELLSELRLLLTKKPHTIKELEEATGSSTSTIFRYLKLLTEKGTSVTRVGITRPTQYKID